MIIKKIFILIISILMVILMNGNLFAESSQTFTNVKVEPGEKKYVASLLMENADLEEVLKVLSEYTGAQINVAIHPKINKKITVEFHFNESKAARKLVWYGKKATVKTYITKGEDKKAPEVDVNIVSKPGSQGTVYIKLGEKITVEYNNIGLEDLLKRFGEFTKVAFKLDDELKKKNIRVNLNMKNFALDDALKALASMESLVIKKLDDELYLVSEKK